MCVGDVACSVGESFKNKLRGKVKFKCNKFAFK